MLYIAGYTDIGSTTRGSIAIPLEPPASEQALEVGPNSSQSEAFKPDICIVKLSSDEDCMIDIGDNPDATNSARKLMAGKEQVVSVPMGKGFKVAVAASTATGSVTGMDSLEALLNLVASPDDAKKKFVTLQDQTVKFKVAVAEFKAANDQHAAMLAQLATATQGALDAKTAADKAAADVAEREVRLDRDAQDHTDGMKADKAAADEQAKALATREAALLADVADFGGRVEELAKLRLSMDTREQEMAEREAAVAASQADYEDRIAKLKALTA